MGMGDDALDNITEVLVVGVASLADVVLCPTSMDSLVGEVG